MIDALVLAGSSNKGELVTHCGAAKEALIKFGEKPMIIYVLQALFANKQIDRICVVGLEQNEVMPYLDVSKVLFCQAGNNPIDSFTRGCQHLRTNKDKVLVLTADIPLITQEAIQDFLDSCSDDRCDIFYPIVDKRTVEIRYPGVQRTYVKLKDGTFTGGNVFLIKTQAIEAIRYHGEQLINHRKSPLQIARYLGYSFILKYLVHQLSIKDIVERVAEIADTTGKAIITQYPEIGFDVDKLSDYRIVQKEFDSKIS